MTKDTGSLAYQSHTYIRRTADNWRIIVLIMLALVTLAGSAAGQSAKTSLKDPDLALRFNAISDRVMCQCACQVTLRVCNHTPCPEATPMRALIEDRLLEGKSDDEIVDEFVSQLGLKVLSSPPAEGLNLAAWVMPGVAVLFGLIIVGYLTSSWTTRRRLAGVSAANATTDNENEDTALRQRIEKELTELE